MLWEDGGGGEQGRGRRELPLPQLGSFTTFLPHPQFLVSLGSSPLDRAGREQVSAVPWEVAVLGHRRDAAAFGEWGVLTLILICGEPALLTLTG